MKYNPKHCAHCGHDLVQIVEKKSGDQKDQWYECLAPICESGGGKQYRTKEEDENQPDEALDEGGLT